MNPLNHSQKFYGLATCSGGAAGLEVGQNGPPSAKTTPYFRQKARSAFLFYKFYKFRAYNALFFNKLRRLKCGIGTEKCGIGTEKCGIGT
jgi:hypothetical protein